MKWVRCIKEDGYRLSEGKVYKVIDFYRYNRVSNVVIINDNHDNESHYVVMDHFEDVTLEVERERKLNKILNE
jgi:hypothetical protein